jgi:nitrite reductase/ring-hydroxylating ferredoxin subunit
MLDTRQKVLRDFWYATVPMDWLKDRPKPFKLLGQEIVLFADKDGLPAALEDRCCHRTAKLSKGWINNGNIVCGYHDWEYDREGQLVMIPQFPLEQQVPDAKRSSIRVIAAGRIEPRGGAAGWLRCARHDGGGSSQPNPTASTTLPLPRRGHRRRPPAPPAPSSPARPARRRRHAPRRPRRTAAAPPACRCGRTRPSPAP